VRQGQVWLVTLDPTVGSEIQKTRPCLIVSPDELNGALRRVIIAPLTSGSHPAPFRVAARFRDKPGLVLLDQIRTVDKKRLLTRMGELDRVTLRQALEVLARLFS
jgi:mRNA interferase MazF